MSYTYSIKSLSYAKAQSAIEYLMTYGWMLLVVAIVSGAIFSMVGDQNIESTSGFTGNDLDISDFGLTAQENRLQMEVRNTAANRVEINYVNVSDGENYALLKGGPNIDIASSNALSVLGIEQNNGNNILDVAVDYNQGNLENLRISGTLTGSLNIIETYNSSYSHEKEPNNLQNILGKMEGNGTEQNPYLITNDYELQAMNASNNSYYKLANNIDAANTADWNQGKGFEPIGNSNNQFTGNLDGDGYEIHNLAINRPDKNEIGLFGRLSTGAEISNISLINVDIVGAGHVGALAGESRGSRTVGDVNFSNVHTSGDIEATENWRAGGIAGYLNRGGLIARSSSSADIDAQDRAGGLVGQTYREIEVRESFATGDVEGKGTLGGLIGRDHGQDIFVNNSYAVGDVRGTGSNIGGLVGTQGDNSPEVELGTIISNSFAVGEVVGDSDVGGLIGDMRTDALAEGYWDVESTGQTTGVGNESGDAELTGLSTNEMQGSSAQQNMDLDWESIWSTASGYPILQWQDD